MQPANQEEILLFTLMGQALLNLQVLEDTLSRSITLKGDVGLLRKVSRERVDELLKERQSLTLGQAIGAAAKKELYADDLHEALRQLQEDRNWFIHKCIDEFYTPIHRSALGIKLKTLALEAHRLQRRIEDDLIEFFETNGIDMSVVRKASVT